MNKWVNAGYLVTLVVLAVVGVVADLSWATAVTVGVAATVPVVVADVVVRRRRRRREP